MGAPLDVLIKQFRSKLGEKRFASVDECAEAFFSYIWQEWDHSDQLQISHANQMLTPVYLKIWQDTNYKFGKELEKTGKNPNLLLVLISSIEHAISEYEKYSISESLADITEEMLAERYNGLIDEVIRRSFRNPPINENQLKLFRRVGILALHREVFSDVFTGFVFAGFGESQVFPSIFSYDVDGIVCGKLKRKMDDPVVMERSQLTAKIIPFAQREVVDRFLVGIDPELEHGINQHLQETFEITRQKIFSNVKRMSNKNRAAVTENLESSLGVMVSDFCTNWLEEIKKSYSKQTEDMVLFMAKQESAHLAESLVNITSLKRKYSPDEESVGGPVDVAVISRNDGFVWVKRKHYFEAELNPRYVARKFGAMKGSKKDATQANE
jgi:hypothetical protein